MAPDTTTATDFDELAALWPRLSAALARDTAGAEPGTSSGVRARGGGIAGQAPAMTVNADVLEARRVIVDGTRRVAGQMVPLLRLDPRRHRSTATVIRALPVWVDQLERRGDPYGERVTADVARWVRRARAALGLQTRRAGLGHLCPWHREQPAELQREGDQAVLADSILAGRGQRRDAAGRVVEAPLTWQRTDAVCCTSCGRRWAGIAELRILMAMIEQANASQRLLDGPALATALERDPSTVRSWASKGWITRHGTDARGRALYDLDQALAVAEANARA